LSEIYLGRSSATRPPRDLCRRARRRLREHARRRAQTSTSIGTKTRSPCTARTTFARYREPVRGRVTGSENLGARVWRREAFGRSAIDVAPCDMAWTGGLTKGRKVGGAGRDLRAADRAAQLHRPGAAGCRNALSLRHRECPDPEDAALPRLLPTWLFAAAHLRSGLVCVRRAWGGAGSRAAASLRRPLRRYVPLCARFCWGRVPFGRASGLRRQGLRA
jgi:hypothetical protein